MVVEGNDEFDARHEYAPALLLRLWISRCHLRRGVLIVAHVSKYECNVVGDEYVPQPLLRLVGSPDGLVAERVTKTASVPGGTSTTERLTLRKGVMLS